MSMYNLNALYNNYIPWNIAQFDSQVQRLLVHDGIVSLKLCDVVNCNQTVQPELG